MTDAKPALRVIKAFGGLTATARAYRCPISTVQGWKVRGTIPQEHWDGLLDAARQSNVDLSLGDFLLNPQVAA